MKRIENSEIEIITNTPYKDLFVKDHNKIERILYAMPYVDSIDTLNTTRAILSLALLLQDRDQDRRTIYGVEITCKGKGRSARIPLARISDRSQTIWKLVNGIKQLERAVSTLDDLIYFLERDESSNCPTPSRVIILKEKPDKIKEARGFVREVANANNLVVFSLDFMLNLLKSSRKINVEELLTEGDKLYLS